MINEVLDVIIELSKTGISMIVVTHEMGFAKKVANKMIFMDHGKIVETGYPNQFFKTPKNKTTNDFLNKIIFH